MTETGPAAPRMRLGVILPFLLISLIWGSTWLVIKDQIGAVPPSWTIAYRFIVAAAGMFLFAVLRGEPLRLPASGHLVPAMIGISQFSFNFHMVYRAEAYLTSGLVAVIFALLMVPNAVIGRIALGHPISRGFVFGSAIAVAGIALMILHEYRIAPPTAAVGLGTAMVIVAILACSAANVVQGSQSARRVGPVPLMAWAMLWGALANVVIALIVDGPPLFDSRPAYSLGVLYLGLIGSVLAFPLYTQLIRDIGPGPAGYANVLVPVVAMLLSTLFEGYRWSLLAGVGAALAMLGLVVALSARRPSR